MKIISFKKRSLTLICSLIFSLIFLIGAGYFVLTKLIVKKIDCLVQLQNQVACPDFVQAELEKQLGGSLLFNRFDLIAADVAKCQVGWQVSKITKNLKGTVSFVFEQKAPIYGIKTNSAALFLIGANGLIMAEATASDLPQLQLAENSNVALPAVGSQLQSDLSEQLSNLFASLSKQNIPYLAVSLDNDRVLHLQLKDGRQVTLLLAKAPQELSQLGYLLLHQEQLKPQVSFTQIDLRFKYPVLK
jgi:hypothetical protein